MRIEVDDRAEAVERVAIILYQRHAKTPWEQACDAIRIACRADAEAVVEFLHNIGREAAPCR